MFKTQYLYKKFTQNVSFILVYLSIVFIYKFLCFVSNLKILDETKHINEFGSIKTLSRTINGKIFRYNKTY